MQNPDDIIAHLSPVISPWRRFRALAALLAGVVGGGVLGSLWLTEPGPLPERTVLAFALLEGVCVAWACFGGWALLRRTAMFALDRVVAGWLAVAASTVMTLVMTAITATRGRGALAALAVGLVFVGAAATAVVHAQRRRNALLRRKHELESDT